MNVTPLLAADARPFFDHPTQRRGASVDPAELHDNGILYRACGPVCGAFHAAPWPGVWMAHYGVKPEAWGQARDPARAILRAFWDEMQPARIVGWTKESNRAAIAFARRIGFTVDGRLDLQGGAVIMQGWTP